MQRIGLDGGRIKKSCLYLALAIALVLLDQILKTYFLVRLAGGTVRTNTSEKITLIPGFFYFSYTYNPGAAWSFLASAEWGQIFFKILTVVALAIFFVFYVYVQKKGYRWLRIAMIFIIGGTIGNFIDRVAYGCVVDFISFIFGSYHFPVFNMADVYMTVGVIMFIIHYLFLDGNSFFGKNAKNKISDK